MFCKRQLEENPTIGLFEEQISLVLESRSNPYGYCYLPSRALKHFGPTKCTKTESILWSLCIHTPPKDICGLLWKLMVAGEMEMFTLQQFNAKSAPPPRAPLIHAAWPGAGGLGHFLKNNGSVCLWSHDLFLLIKTNIILQYNMKKWGGFEKWSTFVNYLILFVLFPRCYQPLLLEAWHRKHHLFVLQWQTEIIFKAISVIKSSGNCHKLPVRAIYL